MPQHYVDAFVVAVPNAQRAAYIALAQRAETVFRRHGAVDYIECWGEDVPEGKLTSFPMAVKCEPGESVIVSWIVWPSKTARDAGNALAMADPDLNDSMKDAPFDTRRMIFGGFERIV
jgi:uncharacterized protein YbaA (DUF1428 family)